MNLRRKAKIRGRGAIRTLLGLSKRERFIFSVIILSLGLFISEHLLGKSGVFTIFTLAILTDILLLLSLYHDFKENYSWQIFILPFFFSLAFGLFSFFQTFSSLFISIFFYIYFFLQATRFPWWYILFGAILLKKRFQKAQDGRVYYL